MKLLKHSLKARILSLLAAVAALLIASPLPGLHAQKTRDETTSVTRWESSDNGLKRRFEIRGKAEFTDDYTDIKSVSEDGWVIIEERRDRESLRYEVRRDTAGQLTRAFFVNGTLRPLDERGKAWLAKFVLDAVRQGGFDADKRVRKILAQKGVAGVLAEIDQISGDYAKRVYYEQLIKQANLEATALRDVLRQTARDISSDYEQAQVLLAVAPLLTGKDAAIQTFFDAVATIESDYERSRVLQTVLKQSAPSRAVLVLVAGSTKSISSDYEKAGVLKGVAAVYLDDPTLRELFFQTVGSIESDYERRGVLTALVKTKSQSEEVLRLLLDSAASISSDYEKATFLVEVSNVYTGDTRLRTAFLKAVESIKSDYERGRVLSALLKNKQIG
jgi:methylphosphotriester-DNA--protein-cysteine methyltransferase